MDKITENSLIRLRSAISGIRKTSPSLYFLILSLRFRKKIRINRKRINGKQNLIANRHAVLNGVKFNIVGNNNNINIESMAVLDGVTFHIQGSDNSISIGAECRIANSIIIIEGDSCEIKIGHHTTFCRVHLAVTEDQSKAIVGEDCMLASDIDIRTGDSHGVYDKSGKRINIANDVLIGDHVWVAERAIILKGCNIGAGSIVGTGAIITKGVYPANCVLAGNPAKVVKKEIHWTRLRLSQIDVV